MCLDRLRVLSALLKGVGQYFGYFPPKVIRKQPQRVSVQRTDVINLAVLEANAQIIDDVGVLVVISSSARC